MSVVVSLMLVGAVVNPSHPVVHPNQNIERAGVLRNGVLTVVLDAGQALVWLTGPRHAPMTIQAFNEPGHQPLMPGPLIRAPQGTELRLSIHNSLDTPLTFVLPDFRRAHAQSLDTLVIAPAATGHIDTRLATAGNYAYRGATPAQSSRVMQYAGLLTGALIVDSANAPMRPRDHVFIIMMTGDSEWVAYADTASRNLAASPAPPVGRFVWTINGESWPRTERIHATVGDSLHWRIINASREPHPMHLHGFYYRVDAFSAPLAAVFGKPTPGQMVVTQLMSPFSTMSMTWSPSRPGNWLFHCHIAVHLAPDSVTAAPDDPDMRDMIGLVIGTEVAGRRGITLAGAPASASVRRLRLVAEGGASKPGESNPDSVPTMRFVLHDGARTIAAAGDFSPELDLIRGEPVAITIVNHLGEPTTVHWHGIEIEDSYADGVAGFSGEGAHLSPAIAPGDSFVARFTPPRAGTFMYHAHVDEAAEQLAGLEGALIVHDRGDTSSADDHVIFLKGAPNNRAHPLEIDGRAQPDTIVLHVGRTALLRLLNLATVNSAPIAELTANPDSALTIAHDSMLVRWLPIAKDGYPVPLAAQVPGPAWRDVAAGETYDFAYVPREAGMLHLEFRTNGPNHRLIIRIPIRVE